MNITGLLTTLKLRGQWIMPLITERELHLGVEVTYIHGIGPIEVKKLVEIVGMGFLGH